MDRYVVIGNPVRHSKSPLIHSLFSRQTGQELNYTTMHVEPGEFPRMVDYFFSGGGKGANVTVPFKQEAHALVSHLSPEAELAGAVNTLYLNTENELCGHNTDGLGLVRDVLDNQGGTLAGRKILLLGAGGATRGILGPLLARQPASLCIANRTVEKAVNLTQVFTRAAGAVAISGCGLDDLAGNGFDWVFNATSASLHGELPPLPDSVVGPNTWCYDLMYAEEPTVFCRWAETSGAGKVMDGLGMLVEQAAESFQLWRGVRPETRAVLDRLRQG